MTPNEPYRSTAERRGFLAVLALMAVWNPLIVEREHGSLLGGTDFLNFYAGARLATDAGLYDPDAVVKVQNQAGWYTRQAPYTRPPFYAILLWPLGRLPFQSARALWQVLNLAAGGAFIWMSRNSSPTSWTMLVAAVLASFPLYASFVNGQDVPLFLALLAGSRLLWKRGQPLVAGVVLAFCSIKFHLLLALPIYLVRRKEWRLTAGIAIGGAGLMALSFLTQGLSWPLRYWRLIGDSSFDAYVNPGAKVMPNLHGLLSGVLPGTRFELLAASLVVVLCWYACGHRSERCAYAAMLISGLLMSRHAYTQDAAMLIPAGLALTEESRDGVVRAFGLLCLCTLLWILPGVPGLSGVPVLCMLLLLGLMCFEVRESRVTTTHELECAA